MLLSLSAISIMTVCVNYLESNLDFGDSQFSCFPSFMLDDHYFGAMAVCFDNPYCDLQLPNQRV